MEVSLNENNKAGIREHSKGSYLKLDTYNHNIFFEGAFMIKSILYLLSWALKLISISLMKSMKNKSTKIVAWKLKYLLYQRKTHFSLMMACVMDFIFTGGGVLLRRRNNSLSIVIKTVCCLNITLIVIDLIEAFQITSSLKFEKEQSNEQGKDAEKKLNRIKPSEKKKEKGNRDNLGLRKMMIRTFHQSQNQQKR